MGVFNSLPFQKLVTNILSLSHLPWNQEPSEELMGSSTSKLVLSIAEALAPIAIELALGALGVAATRDAKEQEEKGHEKGDDKGNLKSTTANDLQTIINNAGTDNKNHFGISFEYVYNGQLSKPPYHTAGPIFGDQDFIFYSPNNPDLNGIQGYIGNLLQPMTQAGYDTDSIALAVNTKLVAVFNTPGSAWVYTNQSFTATSGEKTVQVDLQIYTFNGFDAQDNKFTFCAVNTVFYNSESLFNKHGGHNKVE